MIDILCNIATIVIILIIVFTFNFIFVASRLDRITRFKHDHTSISKHFWILYCTVGLLCYLFFKRLKTARKEDYFNYIIKIGKADIHIYRYFKLKKLKHNV